MTKQQNSSHHFIEWTKPLISAKVHKQQLKQIRDQLHRFEFEVWAEDRKKHTQISWYKAVLDQIHTIAFSEDKKHFPKKDLKISAMQNLFKEIEARVLYDLNKYPHYNGFQGSGGYELAQAIKKLIAQATYIFPHNPDFKKKNQLQGGQKLQQWEELDYEDVIAIWKQLRAMLVDRNQIRIDLKTQISHLIALPMFNYQSWIERRVSENIQILLYQKQKHPLDKWIMTQFVINLLKTQLWSDDNEFKIIEHIMLSDQLKTIYHNLLNLEKMIAKSFQDLADQLKAKVLQSANLSHGILESEYLISPKIHFWHNTKAVWFATTRIDHYRFANQSISYYCPIDPITNCEPNDWIKVVETNDPQTIIKYLQERNLIVQINYEAV